MQTISIVALGVYRHVAAKMEVPFEHTPYRMAAIVDLKSSPEAFTYSAHNLGVVLYALHPPPQVFIVGAAISQSMADESISVWKAYTTNAGTKDPLLINVSFDDESIELVLIRDSFKEDHLQMGIGCLRLWGNLMGNTRMTGSSCKYY